MPDTPAPARRLLTAAALAGLAGTLWLVAGDVLSLDALIARRDGLAAQVAQRPVFSALIYGAAYMVIVVLALPAASLMTLIGGWLFGPLAGTLLTVLAATGGAIVLFLLARGLLRDFFMARSGGALERLQTGFQADAASYLLMLRLAPVFPFFLVNIGAALLGSRPGTYAWTTFLGIVPGTLAYSLAGAGLGSVLDREAARLALCRDEGRTCTASLDASALVSGEVGLALGALAGVTLLSLIIRKAVDRRRRAPPLAIPAKDPHE